MVPDLILFPDGSLRKKGDKFLAGYGVVVLNPSSNEYTTISGSLTKESVVYCEAFAIYQGLRYVEHIRKKHYKGKKMKVFVVSDSKLNIRAFTEWIPYAWDLSDWNNWKKSNKESVKNQEIYRAILKVLKNGKYTVRFVHMNSHTAKDNAAKEKMRKSLKKAKIDLNDTTLDVFVKMNDLADEAAKSHTNFNTVSDLLTLSHK